MRQAVAIPPVQRLDVRSLSRLFKALGDETRLRIVALLTHGELCVCHIEVALGLLQANVSRHLGVLRNAGIVETRRDGNWVYYRIVDHADPDCDRQVRALAEGFLGHEALRRDIARLRRAAGPACKRGSRREGCT